MTNNRMTTKNNKDNRIAFRLDDDLQKELEKLRKKKNLSTSDIVRYCIIMTLEGEKCQTKNSVAHVAELAKRGIRAR